MKSLNRHSVRFIPVKSTGKIKKPSNFASEWLETSTKWPEGNGSKNSLHSCEISVLSLQQKNSTN